jgi:hypothetical protein
MSTRALRKKFHYRDNSGMDQAGHAAHWQGFTWQAGPVVVKCFGPWGQMQVWASSEAEGRRVIEHAASAGSWDLSAPEVEWLVSVASGGRNGRSGTMKTKETYLGIEVTKRDGPSGFPSIG